MRYRPQYPLALLTVFLLLSPYTLNARTAGLGSIRPVNRYLPAVGGEPAVLEDFCTAWATTLGERRVWVTAAHCVVDETGTIMETGLLVDAVAARPVIVDFDADVAVLSGGPGGAQPFVLAFGAAAPFAPIWSAGYPYGSKRQHVVVGVFSNLHDDDVWSVYNIAVAPGMSGSPVVDVKTGLVVGLLTRSECPTGFWCPVAKGTPLDYLRAVLVPTGN